MLDEQTRILAGLQESQKIEDPLPLLIERENQEYLTIKNRLENEQKSVLSAFNIFQDNFNRYAEMCNLVNTLFKTDNKKVFFDGMLISKYTYIQKLADITINDNISKTMNYLNNNYYNIKAELESINMINSIIDESKAKSYFVSNTITSYDEKHNIVFSIFEQQTLENKVSNEIPYGAEIIYISEDLSIVRHSGKKFYLVLNEINIIKLEKLGYLI